MTRALFISGYVALLSFYVLIANELGVIGGGSIDALTVPERPSGGGFTGFVDNLLSVVSFAFGLFVDFLALITFQIPGQESASLITALLWIPLTFAVGYVVFTAVRGS